MKIEDSFFVSYESYLNNIKSIEEKYNNEINKLKDKFDTTVLEYNSIIKKNINRNINLKEELNKTIKNREILFKKDIDDLNKDYNENIRMINIKHEEKVKQINSVINSAYQTYEKRIEETFDKLEFNLKDLEIDKIAINDQYDPDSIKKQMALENRITEIKTTIINLEEELKTTNSIMEKSLILEIGLLNSSTKDIRKQTLYYEDEDTKKYNDENESFNDLIKISIQKSNEKQKEILNEFQNKLLEIDNRIDYKIEQLNRIKNKFIDENLNDGMPYQSLLEFHKKLFLINKENAKIIEKLREERFLAEIDKNINIDEIKTIGNNEVKEYKIDASNLKNEYQFLKRKRKNDEYEKIIEIEKQIAKQELKLNYERSISLATEEYNKHNLEYELEEKTIKRKNLILKQKNIKKLEIDRINEKIKVKEIESLLSNDISKLKRDMIINQQNVRLDLENKDYEYIINNNSIGLEKKIEDYKINLYTQNSQLRKDLIINTFNNNKETISCDKKVSEEKALLNLNISKKKIIKNNYKFEEEKRILHIIFELLAKNNSRLNDTYSDEAYEIKLENINQTKKIFMNFMEKLIMDFGNEKYGPLRKENSDNYLKEYNDINELKITNLNKLNQVKKQIEELKGNANSIFDEIEITKSGIKAQKSNLEYTLEKNNLLQEIEQMEYSLIELNKSLKSNEKNLSLLSKDIILLTKIDKEYDIQLNSLKLNSDAIISNINKKEAKENKIYYTTIEKCNNLLKKLTNLFQSTKIYISKQINITENQLMDVLQKENIKSNTIFKKINISINSLYQVLEKNQKKLLRVYTSTANISFSHALSTFNKKLKSLTDAFYIELEKVNDEKSTNQSNYTSLIKGKNIEMYQIMAEKKKFDSYKKRVLKENKDQYRYDLHSSNENHNSILLSHDSIIKKLHESYNVVYNLTIKEQARSINELNQRIKHEEIKYRNLIESINKNHKQKIKDIDQYYKDKRNEINNNNLDLKNTIQSNINEVQYQKRELNKDFRDYQRKQKHEKVMSKNKAKRDTLKRIFAEYSKAKQEYKKNIKQIKGVK